MSVHPKSKTANKALVARAVRDDARITWSDLLVMLGGPERSFFAEVCNCLAVAAMINGEDGSIKLGG